VLRQVTIEEFRQQNIAEDRTPAEAPVMTTVRSYKSREFWFMMLTRMVAGAHHSFNGLITTRFRALARRSRRRVFSYCHTCDADSA
jgi:hypothetical protein